MKANGARTRHNGTRIAFVVALMLSAALAVLSLRRTLNEPFEVMNSEALASALAPRPDLPLALGATDVVVVFGCTVRRDRMSVYGHTAPTTPFLEALAESGVRFGNAVAQAPWTRPSMGSWITGQWPRALQLDDPRPVRLSSRALSLDATTLAERFKALGYRTIGAIANPNLNTRFGFAQGFDVYDEPDKLWRDEQGKVPGADIVDSFLAAVDDTPADQPLFGRLVLVDAHAPRKPPGAFRHAVRSKGAKRTGKRVQTYDAALLELDQHLARLFAEVRSRRPNVLFIFAADHGEGLSRPKRHGVGHGNHLYSSSISVPWIVHHPGLKQPGRTIPDVAMSIDLVPTVLELLGHPVPSDLPGASFADVLRGDAVSIPPRTAFAETFFRKSRKSAAFTGDHLLLRDFGDALKTESPSGFVDALYAVSDWKAENDLVEIETETYVALRASLDAWHVEMDQISAGAPPPAEIAPKESTMNQLRALGYVD